MDEALGLLRHFSGPETYLIFYLAILSCGIGFPLNSDFLMISAAFLAGMGVLKFEWLVGIAILGLLSGDLINYFISRRYGKRILRKWPFRLILPEARVAQAEKYLLTKGVRVLFFVRFMPFVRTVLYFAAGSLQVPARQFFTYDALSTVTYVPILMLLARAASGNFARMIDHFKVAQLVILVSVSLVIAILIFSRKKSSSL